MYAAWRVTHRVPHAPTASGSVSRRVWNVATLVKELVWEFVDDHCGGVGCLPLLPM